MATIDIQPPSRDPFDEQAHPELYVDIHARRVLAFVIDAVIVLVLMIPAGLAVGILGILTLGLGWVLFPAVFAIVALSYLALTLGSDASATIGMRTVGIELRTISGGRMYPLLAALHGLLFWVSVSILTPLILIIGLLSNRGRLLHDMVLGVVMVNAAPYAMVEGERRF